MKGITLDVRLCGVCLKVKQLLHALMYAEFSWAPLTVDMPCIGFVKTDIKNVFWTLYRVYKWYNLIHYLVLKDTLILKLANLLKGITPIFWTIINVWCAINYRFFKNWMSERRGLTLSGLAVIFFFVIRHILPQLVMH